MKCRSDKLALGLMHSGISWHLVLPLAWIKILPGVTAALAFAGWHQKRNAMTLQNSQALLSKQQFEK